MKCLNVIDDFTKESVGFLVDHSISGERVAEFFKSLPILPARTRRDNGPEFDSAAFTIFTEDFGIMHECITLGKPNENAYSESFNSRFRDECLNQRVFRNREEAKGKIGDWRSEYRTKQLHSSLGMKTPKEFAEDWRKCYQTNAA